MEVVALGGEPATGKTTLALELIKQIPEDSFEEFKVGQLRGRKYEKSGILIFGIYEENEEQNFQGTDRLSMSVMPDAKEAISNLEEYFGKNDWTIFFEGDRLFTEKFIMHIKTVMGESAKKDLTLFFLEVDQDVLDYRHEDRNDDQSEKFINGRKTKYRKLRKNLSVKPHVEIFQNNDEEDFRKGLERIKEEVF